jgi:hypothetical protein
MDGIDRRQMQLWFLAVDPRDGWDGMRAYAGWLAEEGSGRVVWASPFLPTIPGTDRYVDEL